MKEVLILKDFRLVAMVTMLYSCTGARYPRIEEISESMGQRVTCMGALYPQKYTQCIPQDEPNQD